MFRDIFVLIFNDLAIAFKNKTIFLVLFIPLFVFVSLTLIDQPDVAREKIKIGLIQGHGYTPVILQSVRAADTLIDVTWLENEEYGLGLLKEHKIDGLLIDNAKVSGSLSLVVLKKESLHTLAIVEGFSALQKAAEGNHASWITEVTALHVGSLQRQTLPTWILMLVLLVGFVILPAQVAEEREKKLLLALLQTPIHEVQWLIAKVITGMILIVAAVLLLHVLGQYGPVNYVDYMMFIIAGGFCFCAFGVFLGFLCNSQASARTLGLIFYVPLLLPSALSDVSQKLTSIAPFLPSYQLYMPLQSILLEDGRMGSLSFEWICLLLVGALMFCLSYWRIKKR